MRASSVRECSVLARILREFAALNSNIKLARGEQELHDFLEELGVSTRFETYGVAPGEPERMVRDALEGVRGKNFIGAAP